MPTIGPTTIDSAASIPRRRVLGVTSLGVRWALVYNGSATELWYSTNQGAGWAQDSTGGNLSISEGYIHIDKDNYAHVVGMNGYRVDYFRGTPNAGHTSWTWTSFISPQNASINGYPAVVAHREGTGWKVHIVWSRYGQESTGYYEYRCYCSSTMNVSCSPCTGGSHGHTTYTNWQTPYPTCTCPYGGLCNTYQYGYHSHNASDPLAFCDGCTAGVTCTCSHEHLCVSSGVQSRWIDTGSYNFNYVYYARYNIASDQTRTLDQSATVIGGSYGLYAPTKPVLDFHHTGDGITVKGGTPHLYAAWRTGTTTGLLFKRATYSGGGWAWGTQRTIASGYTPNYISGVFDGDRFLMATDRSTTPFTYVYHRDSGDTATTTYTPNAAPGTIQAVSLTVAPSQDIHMFVNDAGSADDIIRSVYTRSAGTWANYTTIEATSVTAETVASRPHSYGGTSVASSDTVWFDGSFLRFGAETFNVPPTAATWNTTGGIAYDTAVNLTLDWNFNDPDLPSDSQSAYTVRRRVGTGAYGYWNGSTWAASESGATKIASSNTSLVLSSWGNDTDATHYYAVKTWDAADTGPSSWSTEVDIIPSAKDNPTITPALTTITASSWPIAWTVATQTAYRVVVSDTSSTTNMDAGTLEFDTGWVNGSTLSTNGTFPTNSVTRYVRVQTKNDEGLLGNIAEDSCTVDYLGSLAASVTLLENDTDGAITVRVTNPLEVGTVGSVVGADANDPVFLDYTGEQYLYLPGTAGNYASTPDHASLDVTGDIDLIARVQPSSWDSDTVLVSKYSSAGARSYMLKTDPTGTGRLALYWSENGTAQNIATSTAATGFADGQAGWVRATLDVDGGAGGVGRVTFYTSTDGSTWTPLGATVDAGSAPSSIFSGASALEVGSYAAGSAWLLNGRVYRAIVKNGIDGTTVFDADFTDRTVVKEPFSTFVEGTGKTVTINRSATGIPATVVDRRMAVFDGSNDYLVVDHDALIDFNDEQDFTAYMALRPGVVPYATQHAAWLYKALGLSTAKGYVYWNPLNTSYIGMRWQDGTNAPHFSNVPIATRIASNMGMRFQTTGTDTGSGWKDGVQSGADYVTELAGSENTTDLFIGQTGYPIPPGGQVHGVAIFRSALSDAAMLELGSWDWSDLSSEPIWLRDNAVFYWNIQDGAAWEAATTRGKVVNLAPAGGLGTQTTAAIQNEVWRREVGTTNAIRINEELALNGVFEDWAVAHQVEYEYQVATLSADAITWSEWYA